MRLVFACCLALLPVSTAWGQAYILRPGPRGFDPALNAYGATEQGAPAIGDERFNPTRTTLRIELLMPAGGSALEAQQWSRTLAEWGYQARMRQPVGSDKPQISESSRGPLRFVTLVGTLDRRGTLAFPGRSFGPGQAAELKEWLDELKSYGAQGSPDGQPLWGLTRAQFDGVYSALAAPVAVDLAGLPLDEAIEKLSLPKTHPVRFSIAAKKSLDDAGRPAGVSRGVVGLTTGTTLAFALSEYGLGFRPERTPEGTIELLIEPLPESASAEGGSAAVFWPVGWEIEEAPARDRNAPPVKDKDAELPNRVRLAPTLFKMSEVGFARVSIADALAAIEAGSGVPVLIDRVGIAAAGIDLKKTVNVPPRRTSWSLALRYVTVPHLLRHELRRDERGQPLVWVKSAKGGR